MRKAEGQNLKGLVFSPEWLDAENAQELAIDFETTVPSWALMMSVSYDG